MLWLFLPFHCELSMDLFITQLFYAEMHIGELYTLQHVLGQPKNNTARVRFCHSESILLLRHSTLLSLLLLAGEGVT